jgi:hypothetical protein
LSFFAKVDDSLSNCEVKSEIEPMALCAFSTFISLVTLTPTFSVGAHPNSTLTLLFPSGKSSSFGKH